MHDSATTKVEAIKKTANKILISILMKKNDLVASTKQFLFETSFRHNIVIFLLTDDDPDLKFV